jgi:hypothetical protein
VVNILECIDREVFSPILLLFLITCIQFVYFPFIIRSASGLLHLFFMFFLTRD